ncbi:hypothetical protein [Rubrivivax gelatinosus]|uniref:Tetratricopeptide repeat protein n=1 Tax=Rubrivivax gelatinosus (strain NBRC 100245 / IL144) TaxID=983917 RepID=I0HP48_RUBGI|nr:hypothetical protein [Rubrivivax gelatinosus]MBG6081393.1 hypothetical protein [Rubrivivax gelatinosus]BAL94785.1 hypothetical protein RGE_14440 [Rubrivivax gelatinosus IL144]
MRRLLPLLALAAALPAAADDYLPMWVPKSTESRWEAVRGPYPLALEGRRFVDDVLSATVVERRFEQESERTRYRYEWTCNAPGGGCSGDRPSIAGLGRTMTEENPTGRTRWTSVRSLESFDVPAQLLALDAENRTLASVDTVVAVRDGQFMLPLPPLLARLPAALPRPATVRLLLALPRAEGQAGIKLSSEQFDELASRTPQWMPPAERLAVYREELKARLLAEDDAGALPVFEKIAAVGEPLPAVFTYRWGLSLMKAGRSEEGRAKLQAYLKQAGAQAPDAEAARRWLKATAPR